MRRLKSILVGDLTVNQTVSLIKHLRTHEVKTSMLVKRQSSYKFKDKVNHELTWKYIDRFNTNLNTSLKRTAMKTTTV